MRRVCSFRIPHSAFRILALLLAAQAAPGCIERYDHFWQGMDGEGIDIGGKDGAADRSGDHGSLEVVPADVREVNEDVCGGDVCICQPDCAGRNCGSDGCGGSCGSCSGCESLCTADGHCQPDPKADSGCFDDDIYWKDSCGTWGEKATECGEAGCSPGSKVCADCEDLCSNVECGMQRECNCGTCPTGKSCQAGTCEVTCGDGQCGAGEDKCNCPADCTGGCAGCCAGTQCKAGTANSECGQNGGACASCGGGKTCQSQACAYKCGDTVCAPAGNETCSTCPGDCGPCCPNGACDNGETRTTCPADCGQCPGQCSPSCDPTLEECVQATTGGWVCTSKMVEVPAGNFWMGCNNCAGSTVNDTCDSDEDPYHEVYLDAYEIDKTEVTAAQYLACKNAGGCTAAGSGSYATYQVGGKEKHPINYVSWSQAGAYCLWVGKQLCTEAQWEKGARGGCEKNGGPSNCKAQSRKFPWGNETASCQFAVMYEGGYGCGTDSTMAVCSKSPVGDSPYGLCDMAGNVWEWVADWYQKDYYCDGPAASGDQYCTECGSWPGSPTVWSNPPGPGSGSVRVVRGGSFVDGGGSLRVSNRLDGDPSVFIDVLGLRCCRSE